MGLEINGLKMLLKAREILNNDFNFAMLGRQEVHVKSDDIDFNLPEDIIKDNLIDSLKSKYIEDFVKYIGAKKCTSIDFSEYEGATEVFDISGELPKHLENNFDFIFDGGTLEHVYNFPKAISNCKRMLKMNGLFGVVTMANNFCGHGFYQFSPELFFRIFSENQGYRILGLYLAVENGTIYKVTDPETNKRRSNFRNSKETYMIVLAQKITNKPEDISKIYQSDYVNLWSNPDQKKHYNFLLKLTRKFKYIFRINDPELFKKVPSVFSDI